MKINWFKIEEIDILILLTNSIDTGSGGTYDNFLKYLKQGYYCKDCDEMYKFCYCNECEKCKYTYCLCDLGLLNENDYTKIRKIIETWIIFNLSKKSLKKLLNKLSLLDLTIKDRFSRSKEENLLIKKIIEHLKTYEN